MATEYLCVGGDIHARTCSTGLRASSRSTPAVHLCLHVSRGVAAVLLRTYVHDLTDDVRVRPCCRCAPKVALLASWPPPNPSVTFCTLSLHPSFVFYCCMLYRTLTILRSARKTTSNFFYFLSLSFFSFRNIYNKEIEIISSHDSSCTPDSRAEQGNHNIVVVTLLIIY